MDSRTPLTTVPSVDLNRYTGTWYEIARLPMWFQRHCVDSKAVYTSRPDGAIGVHNECITDRGGLDHADGVATVVDPKTNARLTVVFDNFFARRMNGDILHFAARGDDLLPERVMLKGPEREILIRRARIGEHLNPLPIYSGDPPEPINADWVGITHCVHELEHRKGFFENFTLYFYSAEGKDLGYFQFDTLQIALDQATAIAGIQPNDWESCSIHMPEDGIMQWKRT